MKKWIKLEIDPGGDLEAISKSLRRGRKLDLDTSEGLLAYGVGLAAATKRIGPKPVQRLRWLLELTQIPRESLASDDRWLEVVGFVSAGRTFISKDIRAFWPPKLVPALDQVEKSLRQLVKEETWKLDFPANRSAFTIVREFGSRKHGPAFFGAADAAMTFLFKADEVVAEEGHRIQDCALPECGRLFVKRKRGTFCRVQCAEREHKRRWREKLGSTKVNSLQRSYYRKKNQNSEQRGRK